MAGQMTTSKRLTWVIIIFYIVAFASVEFVYVKYGKELFQLLNYALPLAMTVVLSYFGKSGFENYNKIKQSVTELQNSGENHEEVL